MARRCIGWPWLVWGWHVLRPSKCAKTSPPVDWCRFSRIATRATWKKSTPSMWAKAATYVLIGWKRHPGLRRGLTVGEFARLDYVIVSLRGGDFTTPVDDGLAALGYQRNVALSAASFLIVPEIVSHSNFVALVPERLVRDRHDELKIVECPFPVPGFTVSMLWHERNHGHSGQRWVRETVMEVTSSL